MNLTLSVRPMPRVPLPRGPEHQAWVIDLTPTEWVRKTWPAHKCPYHYTPAGVWVRRAMPARGYMLGPRLLTRLADFAKRMQGDLHDEFRMPADTPAEDLAQLILAVALVEHGTSFVVLNVQPSGRVWFFHEMHRIASWHPDAPRPTGE